MHNHGFVEGKKLVINQNLLFYGIAFFTLKFLISSGSVVAVQVNFASVSSATCTLNGAVTILVLPGVGKQHN